MLRNDDSAFPPSWALGIAGCTLVGKGCYLLQDVQAVSLYWYFQIHQLGRLVYIQDAVLINKTVIQ